MSGRLMLISGLSYQHRQCAPGIYIQPWAEFEDLMKIEASPSFDRRVPGGSRQLNPQIEHVSQETLSGGLTSLKGNPYNRQASFKPEIGGARDLTGC